MRFGNSEAVKGWDHLCQQAKNNTRRVWEQLSNDPVPAVETPRHHRLKGSLRLGTFEGRDLPRWQYEVTSGGRVWYLLDEDRKTVWVVHAGPGHPKVTE